MKLRVAGPLLAVALPLAGCGKGLKLYSYGLELPVSDSLRFYLDAKFPQGVGRKRASTFPGPGCGSSTWQDLVGGLAASAPCSPGYGWALPYRYAFSSVASYYFSFAGAGATGAAVTQDFSVEFWTYMPAGPPASTRVLEVEGVSGGSTSYAFRVYASAVNIMNFRVCTDATFTNCNAGGGAETTNITAPVARASYYVARRRGVSLELINSSTMGTLIGTGSTGGAVPLTTSTAVLVGNGPVATPYDVGLVALHSRALSNDEISQNCEAIRPRFTDGVCPSL